MLGWAELEAWKGSVGLSPLRLSRSAESSPEFIPGTGPAGWEHGDSWGCAGGMGQAARRGNAKGGKGARTSGGNTLGWEGEDHVMLQESCAQRCPARFGAPPSPALCTKGWRAPTECAHPAPWGCQPSLCCCPSSQGTPPAPLADSQGSIKKAKRV